MNTFKPIATLRSMINGSMGLRLTTHRRIQIWIGLICGVSLFGMLYHTLNVGMAIAGIGGIASSALLLAVIVFAPLYIMPLIAIYHLRQANQKLKSTFKIMLRTEKMLRSHNEELELGRLQLAEMAHKDRLTGLKNRRQFDTQFSKYFESAQCGVEGFALILIDLNDFKPINDTHGHASGDSLLREVGVRLRELCRGHRSDVFRLGGDEFAILVKTDGESKVTVLRNEIADSISKPFYLADASITISAALGVRNYTDQASTKELFVQADQRLYADKARKPNANNNEITSANTSVA